MADAPLIPGTLAQDCYPASPQALYDEMFARGHATIPDLVELLVQDAAPDPADRGVKGWIPTSGGIPIFPGGGVFWWHPVVGHWVQRPTKGAGDPRPEMYIGDPALLPTFDGGDAGVPGVASGPMWELYTALDGRVPVGVGTIPDSGGATIGALATQDSNGLKGEYKHVLTGAEGAVGDHVHPMGNGDAGTGDIGLAYTTPAVTTPSYNAFGNTGGGPIALPVTVANLISLKANDGNGVVSDGHYNLQPFLGVYWIKRTQREFYRMG